ncbi:hypothetical protein TPHA_0D03930 [Tetrapisispora phaffii CBS 4417]|uniref:Nop domain-containing protein n=1 Tax=Tetrapisispora phaffii (strain ATCC 24235 / CBS 4417 / NBRC 1672 / NRRL Y-8282 / UCD 70-5) TaxID=1071381 RepID=G8BT55_TETPH|nr:hypothetical protein TPHA_0D03930 [Tetrapisispora phaffii CBS 4417]CCE63026.1 hypothetical protein TPHA_0D03930 [Tetrapisispora phaffii CBS 4417]
MEEEDFFKDLENDLKGSDNEVGSEVGLEVEMHGANVDSDIENPIEYLKEFLNGKKCLLIKDLEAMRNHEILNVINEYNVTIKLLDRIKLENGIVEVASILNKYSKIIQEESSNVFAYIKILYKPRFPELETLLTNPIDFIEVLKLLEENITEISNDDYIATLLENESNISSEKRLVVIMSIKTCFNSSFIFTEDARGKLSSVLELLNILMNSKTEAVQYLSSKIGTIAPNLSTLIGTSIASLLISHTGSILELSKVPSCNLASIGKKKYSSSAQHITSVSGVRQEGYIYNSELIQNMPISTHKQLLRMLCAKVSLAARVDAGLQIAADTRTDNSLGIKWKEEILDKVRKLNEAPNIALVKPLPVPQDSNKKKRSGRRFRKYKEQFQLSNIRKLQNRMEFGKEEQTYMDSTGEEVGLGMINLSLKEASGMAQGITKRTNNSAKLTKKLKHRLQDANMQTEDYINSLSNTLNQ